MLTFANALAVPSRGRVDALVVGGLAVARAGDVGVTDGVDLLADTDTGNLGRLVTVLSAFGDGAAAVLTPEDSPLDEGCIRVAEGSDTDVPTMMSGPTYADLLPLSVVHDVEEEAAPGTNSTPSPWARSSTGAPPSPDPSRLGGSPEGATEAG